MIYYNHFCDDYGLDLVYSERIDDHLKEDELYYRSYLESIQKIPTANKCSGFFMNENDCRDDDHFSVTWLLHS